MDIYFGTYRKKSPEIEWKKKENNCFAISRKRNPKESFFLLLSMFTIHFDSLGRHNNNKRERLIGINFDTEKSSTAGDSRNVILQSS